MLGFKFIRKWKNVALLLSLEKVLVLQYSNRYHCIERLKNMFSVLCYVNIFSVGNGDRILLIINTHPEKAFRYSDNLY